jgi:16S rRNA (cytosine1402-N4)-methyltransferase
MDSELKVKAADLINGLNEGELDELFTKLGEEDYSRSIARIICRTRGIAPIRTCRQLAEIVVKAVPKRARYGRISACHRLAARLQKTGTVGQAKQLVGRHPATRTFQALRIAVNDELNNLREALPQTESILEKGGRLVTLSFHSLEDKIIKDFIKSGEKEGKWRNLLDPPLEPTREEVKENVRSRSAKLRAAEKI